ncbi:hypothetical protein BH18CHL1_BH18CHL1_06320 [soil metagenome]|nr:hypothetical protein [Chloroflexota bacterium]
MASADERTAELGRTLTQLHEAERAAKSTVRGSFDEERQLRLLHELRRRVNRLAEELDLEEPGSDQAR